ncbi:hypothetical protein LCGC14_2784980 [marine sediment metagenome]|uniref:Uncharacterized protein n=1 Tax=marine sediment metagenome TaxID=412755 RepID=A0A0F8YS68_9ZZZZ
MKVLKGFGWALLIIGQLWLSSVVYGGGFTEDMPQQQLAPQEQASDNDWVIPVTVAGIGAVGAIATAAVAARRKKN